MQPLPCGAPAHLRLPTYLPDGAPVLVGHMVMELLDLAVDN